RLRWENVIYESGTVKVVAYDSVGRPMEEKVIHTAGKPVGLRLTADRSQLQAGQADLAFVTVEVVDKDGNLCPDAAHLLTFKVAGAGDFKAVCNGDPTSLEQFHLPQMKAFSGKLVVLVQAGESAGNIM